MKKNKMMRLASFLLIAVLVSTSAISGTYAKYTTQGIAEDSARVAKWGVTVDMETDAMFGEAYVSATGKISASYAAATDSVNATEVAVAPGTNGTVVGIDINGTPEVDGTIVRTAEVTLTGWNADGVYFPLVFKVGGVAVEFSGCTDLDDYATAIEEAIATSAPIAFEAGAVLDGVADMEVTWEWPFSTNAANDAKDTILGNNGAANTIAIRVTCTVEQVD